MDQDNPQMQRPDGPALFDQNVNLRHYWHVILERRWLVVTAFISIFVLSLIYLFKAPRIYQATTRLQIDREERNVLREGMLTLDAREPDYLQTQYKNLMSRTLIESVIRQLKLDKDERYSKAPDTALAVASDISIAPIRLSRLVDIKVEHPDPKRAANMANTLVTNFISQHIDYKMLASTEIVKRLYEEAKTQKKRVEDAEKALDDYRRLHKIVSFDGTENIILQSLKDQQARVDQASSEANAAGESVLQVDAIIKAGKPTNSIPDIARNPDIQALYRDLAASETAFAEIQKRYRHKHPEFIRAAERVTFLRGAINDQARTVIESLRNRAALAKSTEQKAIAVLTAKKKEQEDLNQLKIEYNIKMREWQASDVLHNAVLSSAKERELMGRNFANNMLVRDPAAVPMKPVKPRIVLTLILGVIGGMGVAIGLAFFVNYLDDSIKSQDDVETYLRLPFLGYIPNIKTASVVERDLQSHVHPQSNSAEGFRTVRATISLTHKPERFRVLTVTSTIPSEGKSLVASNLAIVTAQTGLRTLLVDADLRRPSVHKAYQLHSPIGLSSFLMDETDKVEPLIHKTEVPNLDVICCGAVPSTPSELIGSKRMTEFLDVVRGRYDRIILDCPPISAVSDPLIIAAMSDGVVYVTKFNKIRREHARKSVQRLQNAGIHIVGLVLNDIDFEGKDSYYYSYYYYQNRYYASHYKSSSGRPGKKGAELAEKSKETPRGGNGG